MKKLYSIALITCLLVTTFFLTGCGSKSVDEAFKADLMKGLSARWDLVDKDEEDADLTDKSDYESFIAAEYDVISKYKKETFEDKELGKLAVNYIETLEAANATFDDYGNTEKWSALWSNVIDNRLEALLALNEKLDIQFTDESDQEDLEGLLSQGKVVMSVRELMKTTTFEKKSSDFGWSTYSAVVENTTEESFSYFSFKIKLMDKDGVTIETTSAYTESWAPGDKAKFEFETNADFAKMKITNCAYNF